VSAYAVFANGRSQKSFALRMVREGRALLNVTITPLPSEAAWVIIYLDGLRVFGRWASFSDAFDYFYRRSRRLRPNGNLQTR